jgi:hypothetical protein
MAPQTANNRKLDGIQFALFSLRFLAEQLFAMAIAKGANLDPRCREGDNNAMRKAMSKNVANVLRLLVNLPGIPSLADLPIARQMTAFIERLILFESMNRARKDYREVCRQYLS